jgi:transposase
VSGQRDLWRTRIASADPARLVFLDETAVKTTMTRLYGRARRGQRAVDEVPCGRWRTTTLIAAITLEGARAAMLIEGATDSAVFETYVECVLVPELRPGMIVVLDNLSPHKSARVAEMIERAGAELWPLPPYSPDFNPIELMWSKVKTLLRAAKARTEEELFEATARVLQRITPSDASAWFRHCFVSTIN